MVKVVSVFALVIVFLATMAMAELPDKSTEDKKPESICPKTLMKNDCMGCHVMSGNKWILKETLPDAHLVYPAGTKIINYGKQDAYGSYTLGDVDAYAADQVKEFFQFLRNHDIRTAKIEILSGGGNIFLGWRIKSLIEEWQAEGGTCSTSVKGVAASAAFIVFLAGEPRIVNARAELMSHEVRSWIGGFLFIKEITPASAEEEAKVFKHLQSNISSWIASRGKISKEKLDDMMRFREFWMTGKEAYEYGFATVLVGQ